MDWLLQDLRFTLRTLVRSPGFTAVALATLALAIGANTAIFSVVQGILLRPLPYEESDRIAMIWQQAPQNNVSRFPMTHAHFAAYRDQSEAFELIAAYSPSLNLTVTGIERPEVLRAATVSKEFFPLLRVDAALGRTFLAEEDRPGGDAVAVLSHGAWQRLFGGNPEIVGKSLRLDSSVTEIIGVMPASFDYPRGIDVWIPLQTNPELVNAYYLWAIGRLKQDQTMGQAKAEMDALAVRFAESRPDVHPDGADFSVAVTPLRDELTNDTKPALLVLLAAVGLVLLIACVNVANLFLSRCVRRQREFAVRGAIGASRMRLVRQLLAESTLLAFLGGGAGLILAQWGVGALTGLAPDGVPRLDEVTIDYRILAFSFVLSLVCGWLVGLAPALLATRRNLHDAMKQGPAATTGPSAGRLNASLVAAQFALSMVLLFGAGLLVKSFLHLLDTSPGFRPENVLTMRIGLSHADYPEGEDARLFFERLLARVRALPGVRAAGASSLLPMSGRDLSMDYLIEGREELLGSMRPLAEIRFVTPGYFTAMGMDLIEGRFIDDRDTRESGPAAVIDEEMARRYWPDGSAVGKRLRHDSETEGWLAVVGVVSSVRHHGVDQEAPQHVYEPAAQNGSGAMSLAIRSTVPPESLTETMRRELAAMDANLAIHQVRTLEEAVSGTLVARRFTMVLLGLFAGMALLLSAIGIYGVISYDARSRTRELGVRLAIGSRREDVFRMVIVRGLTPAIAGTAVGFLVSFGLARWMSSLIVTGRPFDGWIYAAAGVILAAAALVACYLPARRASRTDPMAALRID